jgi:hypothetical protein
MGAEASEHSIGVEQSGRAAAALDKVILEA